MTRSPIRRLRGGTRKPFPVVQALRLSILDQFRPPLPKYAACRQVLFALMLNAARLENMSVGLAW